HGQTPLVGVIGSLPYSMLSDDKRGKAYDYEDLLVDVGLSAEATQANVAVGDFITFNQPVHELLSGKIATKAIDNRACVAALTVALNYLQTRSHEWDLIFVATVQEETRLLGGFTAAFDQKPDAAIALDVSHAKQPGVSEPGAYAIGSGPILDIGVNIHPGMYAELIKAARALEMKTSILTHTRASGTETSAVQLTEAGIPTALISIAIRNMHTMVESLVLKDITRAGRLTGEFAARLDHKFLDKLRDSLFA
ncbi:MAG: M42 family peptidase, partial [Candidatus Promineifilaceae bacterium]